MLKALRKNDLENVKYAEPSLPPARLCNTLTESLRSCRKCIPLLHTFDFYGHTCLVTPLLSASVFDFLKDNSYEPFPLSHVQSFAKQLLTSIKCQSCVSCSSGGECGSPRFFPIDVHDSKLIHTDLKPENILLEDNASVVIPGKVCRPFHLSAHP